MFNVTLFRSAFVSCPKDEDAGKDFLHSTWRVRYAIYPSRVNIVFLLTFLAFSDTLEQIDIAKLLIAQYPDVCSHVIVELHRN